MNKQYNLVVISNRGPYTVAMGPRGMSLQPSSGGLAAALAPLLSREGGVWVAWGGRCGQARDGLGLSLCLPPGAAHYTMQEILLTPQEVTQYYDGFANSCLWPLCHGFIDKAQFRPAWWQAYRQVNEKYAAAVRRVAPATPAVWVHDYHLALLPAYLRRGWPAVPMAMFWHIPFPPAETFAILPWARELLQGMLACQLVGFHLPQYARNFLQAAAEIAGATVDYDAGTATYGGQVVKTVAVPVGIDWKKLHSLVRQPRVRQQAARIRRQAGGRYLLLGVDRLDYTKGITQRLQAVARLLTQHPAYRETLTFIQVAVPSRTAVPAYQQLRRQVEEMVSHVNGQFTINYRPPVRYRCRPLAAAELAAHYLAADMAVVTPLKDGLNLVAKEYVAANAEGDGVLLLSPFAGVARQLPQALLANPYDIQQTAQKIADGLKLPAVERRRRLQAMYRVVAEQDLVWWWQSWRQAWSAVALPHHAVAAPVSAPAAATPTEEDIA